MTISVARLKKVLDEALNEFFEKEADAIQSNVSERNNCGRLAIYLEARANAAGLTRYYADPEYNRKQGGQIKTILDQGLVEIEVTCDLILHSRGQSIVNDNLIAIEMKKSIRPEAEKDADRDRLRALTKSSYDNIWSNDGTTHPEHVCGYKLGVFIEIDRKTGSVAIEYYRGGQHESTDMKSFPIAA